MKQQKQSRKFPKKILHYNTTFYRKSSKTGSCENEKIWIKLQISSPNQIKQ